MKLNKIILLSALGCFALPIMASEAPKAEETKAEAKADAPKADAAKPAKKAKAKKKAKHHKADAHHAAAPALPTAPTVAAAAPVASDAPTFKIGGFVNAVLNYDLNGFGGDYLNAGKTPRDSATIDSKDKQVLSGNAKATRLTLEGNAKSSFGDVKGYAESDFYGSPTECGDNNGNPNYNFYGQNNPYVFRVRKAYVKVGGFMAGQDDSLFLTYPQATMVDFSGHMGAGFRTPQMRYTYDAGAWNVAVGVEKSDTDTQGVAADRKQQNIPDVTFKVGGKVQDHQFGFRSIWKSAKVYQGTGTASTSGWGFGVDAKIATCKDSAFVAVVNYGKGIGSRIAELQNSFEVSGSGATLAIKAQKMLQWGLGYDHAFNANWKASAGFSQDKLTAEDSANDKKLTRYFGNVRFLPTEKVSLGLEYAYVKNQTGTNNGNRNRLVFGVQYNF